jgi:hypothetical protein
LTGLKTREDEEKQRHPPPEGLERSDPRAEKEAPPGALAHQLFDDIKIN